MALRRVAKVDITLRDKVPIRYLLRSVLLLLIDFPQLIKAGEGIICSNQSANRDEEIFPDPDTFNMYRKRGSEPALGYGHGEHRCIAEWLARAELEIVFGQ